jgi:diadenylate cyclase
MNWQELYPMDWRGWIEVLVLWVCIYNGWRSIRGTRGAKVLTGLALLILFIATISGFFDLPVLGWIFRNVSTAFIFTMIVLFQPEIRRALAALGSHRMFATASQSPEMIEQLAETTFDLANRQLGALIAVERDQNLEPIGESGTEMDAKFTPELVVSLFFPKTPLHDGGVIIRGDRVLFAGCTYPVTQRVDLDRTLGLRHRAAIGLSDESDAVVIVVSEETGVVSICHRGSIQRDFDPESFKRRLGQLLLLDKNEKSRVTRQSSLAGQADLAGARSPGMGRGSEERAKESRGDRLAF